MLAGWLALTPAVKLGYAASVGFTPEVSADNAEKSSLPVIAMINLLLLIGQLILNELEYRLYSN